LIALGHNPREVMDYTPRQANAFVLIASHRRRRELAEQLNITLAAQGDSKAIKATLKELSDDA
jgi:DNA-binding CsgD family transcriptional regulator